MHLLEALAVRTLVHGRMLLVGAHADAVQTAVIMALAVVGAGDDGAFDGLIGSAGAAAVHAIAHVLVPPLFVRFWVLPEVF